MAPHRLQLTGSDILYLTAFGEKLLVIDSWKSANELLVKRSAVYSDRPNTPMLELMGLNTWAFSIMRHGAEWRQLRRLFHQYFHRDAVAQFHPIMYEEREVLIQNLESSPENFLEHIRIYFGTIMMRATYGFDEPERTKALIQVNERTMELFGEASVPGRFLVNLLPFLKHVPAWVPGAGFQDFFREFRETTYRTLHDPHLEAQARMNRGQKSAHPSMIADILSRGSDMADDSERSEYEVRGMNVCGLTYTAGAETSTSAGHALFLALANHPDVQQKAQAELDAVVGPDRSPTIDDRPMLPYIQAILKELMRWFSVTPLGVIHANEQDDVYKGYFIPKGTVIIFNSWAMMHDAETFENPFEFNPDRYMKDGDIDPSVPDPEIAAFGFGRRICPGRHFSKDSLFLMITSVLSTFTIGLPKDDTGTNSITKIPVEINFDNALTAKPRPYRVSITRRQ